MLASGKTSRVFGPDGAFADLKARGFRLAQAVLDESASSHAGADLNRGGMPRVTELLYLERDTALPLNPHCGSLTHYRQADEHGAVSPFRWCPFQPAVESEFHRASPGDLRWKP